MHKGIILLTKAEDQDDARINAESFLEQYQDQVWDWYSLGGRWCSTLNPKTSQFYKLVKEKKIFKDEKFISTKDTKDNQAILQEIWEKECKQTSTNPYNRSSYSPEEYVDDFIMPATKCKKVIKKWIIDLNKQAEEYWKEMLKAKEEAEKGKYDMSSYYAGLYRDCQYDSFSTECNVYDIEEETNTPPKDLTGYFAVMVDIHH